MRNRGFFLISAVSLMALSTAAVAHEADSAVAGNGDVAEGQTAGSSVDSGEIIITARKREESLQKVPLAISAISGDGLREAGVANFRDIQAQVPSLTLLPATSDRSALQLSIRGQFQSEVLLTVDSSVGIYMDGVAVPRSFGISPAMIDLARVEVLKGPQGTLYGRNTTGGAITLTSVRPEFGKWGGFVDAQIGNYGALDLSAAVNIPLADRMALRLVGRSTTSSGIGRDANGVRLANQDEKYFRARWAWDATSNLRFDLTGEYTDIDDGGPGATVSYLKPYPPITVTDRFGNTFVDSVPNGLNQIRVQNGLPNSTVGFQAAQNLWQNYVLSAGRANSSFFDSGGTFPQYIRTKVRSVAFNATLDLSDRISLKSTTGYRYIKRETAVDTDATPFDLLHVTFPTTSKFFSQELNLSYTADRLNMVLGGYYSRETGSDGTISVILPNLSPASVPQYNIGNVENSSKAIYAQATFELLDGLSVTGGIRGTWERKDLSVVNSRGGVCALATTLRIDPATCLSVRGNSYSNISYLASIDYSPARDVLLYVKTSRGFRGGGENLRGTTAASSQAFRPEVATDYEAGVKAELFDRKLRVNAAVYHTSYRDIQRTVTLSETSGSTFTVITNAAKAHITGFEAEVTVRPTPRLTLTGTFAYTKAAYDNFVDLTGDRSSEVFPIPEKTFSLSARYEHPTTFGSVVTRVDYNWQDDLNLVPRAYIASSVTQPAYGLLNARVEFNFENPHISVAVFGRNLADKHYYVSGVDFDTPATGLGWNTLYKGDPRTYGIELRKTF